MTYVDGFVLPVPENKLAAYKKMAAAAGNVWKKHGALQYFECAGDDLNPKIKNIKFLTFPKLAKAKPGENVIFAFIVYKSKAHRNIVNKKVMEEMDANMKDTPMPFDVTRMAYGGFRTIVKK